MSTAIFHADERTDIVGHRNSFAISDMCRIPVFACFHSCLLTQILPSFLIPPGRIHCMDSTWYCVASLGAIWPSGTVQLSIYHFVCYSVYSGSVCHSPFTQYVTGWLAQLAQQPSQPSSCSTFSTPHKFFLLAFRDLCRTSYLRCAVFLFFGPLKKKNSAKAIVFAVQLAESR